MLNKFRRKLANKIHPEPLHDYPIVEVKWQSDEDYKRAALASNHKYFEEMNGRKAMNDDEAINFTRKYVDDLKAKTKKAQSAATE